MSDHNPALALLEFESISAGIVAGDAMVKAAPLGSIHTGTVHPGRYLVLVTGDTASVEVAIDVGRDVGRNLVSDMVFLADAHPSVVDALRGNKETAAVGDEALGIVETDSVAAALDAADAGVKAADVNLAAVRLADGLGGKAYVLFSGTVAAVEAGLDVAVARAEGHRALIRSDLIAQLHGEMADNLRGDLRFSKRVTGGR